MRVGERGAVTVLATGLLMAGCQTIPGRTVASPVLQRDVSQMLMALDGEADRGWRQRKIVNTEVVSVRGGTDFGVQLEK